MARVKGRDVLVDLLDAVAELRATTQRQTEQLDRVERQAGATATYSLNLGRQLEVLTRTVFGFNEELNALTREVHGSKVTGARLDQQLGRVARLLNELAGGSARRFEDIEARLDRLEQKAS